MTRNDKAIETAWRMMLSLMIFSAAACAVTLIYSAFFALIGRQWPVAAAQIMLSTILGMGVVWLCNNRNDLVGAR